MPTILAQAWRPFGPDQPDFWLNVGIILAAVLVFMFWRGRPRTK